MATLKAHSIIIVTGHALALASRGHPFKPCWQATQSKHVISNLRYPASTIHYQSRESFPPSPPPNNLISTLTYLYEYSARVHISTR
ncbi:hypothetical protein L873DRAFT_1799985 [Choiromyces venosus 120613-1]|uniref:Uncharacterized protein n=1 Tax=Choiromyces venosus 120613-1 TaxID=1336337 RepID=A0A3N4K3T5_9PEZI|nr:hypothetical protein L873DRAFT_1799985 [Choiromyces venosus 120613-1]